MAPCKKACKKSSDKAKAKAEAKASEDLSEEMFEEYLSNDSLLPKLSSKVVAITGTTTGLGVAIARVAVVKGARLVLLLNRQSDRAKKSEEDLKEFVAEGSDTEIQTVPCDLMDFESVKSAAATVNKIAGELGGLDVLCNNAGIMAQPDKRTKDGFEVQMQTDQLSHFLLTSLVFDSLKKAGESRGEARVVMQSSSARDTPGMGGKLKAEYFTKCKEGTLGGDGAWMLTQMVVSSKGGPWIRYGQAKLANSAFAMALHHKLAAAGESAKVKSVCCEPGYSVTNLQDTPFMPSWMEKMKKQSAANGSLNAAMACFNPDAKSGDMYAPEKGYVGKPVKVIASGEAVKKGKEKMTCDLANQKLVWEACESALGIEFASLV